MVILRVCSVKCVLPESDWTWVIYFYFFVPVSRQVSYLTAFVPEALVDAMPPREASAPGSDNNEKFSINKMQTWSEKQNMCKSVYAPIGNHSPVSRI